MTTKATTAGSLATRVLKFLNQPLLFVAASSTNLETFLGDHIV